VKANALQSSSDRTLHENSTRESKQPTGEENQSPEVASFPRSGSSCLKLLVSNNVAGSIIGKSGETILKLQRECGCRIKLSQAHDFFPGTSDRVCLLQGDNIDSVKKAVALILKKVRDVRELQLEVSALSEEDRPDPPTDSEDKTLFLTRILVPNPACGMIIGRAGTNIKAIASQTNSKIQMTQKEDMASVATSERVVTVTGSLHACTSCIGKLLDAMSIQPEVSQYANMTTSYKKNPSSAHGEQITTIPAQGLSPRFRPHTADALQPTPLYGLGGFSDLGVSTLSPRTTTLGPQHTISTVPPGYAPHVTTTGPYSAAASHTSFGRDSDGNILLLSSSRSFPTTDRSRLALQDGTFIQANNATFGLTQLPVVTTSATISVQIGVPETMIGAILGRGGSGINDLQLCSGARIEVSQRGSFQPGTTNRIITLTGTEQACTTANFLINQRLSRQTTGFNSR